MGLWKAHGVEAAELEEAGELKAAENPVANDLAVEDEMENDEMVGIAAVVRKPEAATGRELGSVRQNKCRRG